MVVSPPLLFLAAVILVSAVTVPGGLFMSVVVGSVVTLASVAPWLALGMVLTVIITWIRGLPRCIQDLSPRVALRLSDAGAEFSRSALARRSSCGRANCIRSGTASTSSTWSKPLSASRASTPSTRSSGTEARWSARPC